MELLRVDVPDPDSAMSLIDELRNLHSELLPGERGQFEVQVELGDGKGSQIDRALAAVERWLTETGIEVAKVKLYDRTYLLERRTELSPAARTNGTGRG